MYKDIFSESKVIDVFGPVALDADNTPAAIDLKDFRAALLVIAVGVGGITFTTDHKVEFTLTHSDDNVTYVAVAAGDVLGEASVGAGGIIKSLIAAHAAAARYRFGYVGGKRYLKLLANFSGTHGAPTILGAEVIAMRPVMSPVDADA